MGEEPRRFEPATQRPNLLTLLRMCLAPFLVAAILEEHYALSFGLCCRGSPMRWMATGAPAQAAVDIRRIS